MTTITPEQRLTVVKHLASGKTPDMVATITGIDRATIVDIGSHHGYPDKDKLSWAVDILTKKLDQAAADAIPESATPQPRLVTQHGPTMPTLPAAKPDEFRILINTAKGSDSKRIQNLANRILDDVAKLRSMLDAERDRVAARNAKAEAARKIREEIKALEANLAEAKAKLRGSKAKATAPKGEHPCTECGRVFDTNQGRSLHERRAHAA